MASGSASAEHTKPRPCFGRQADLAYLLSRSRSTGLTAVVGPPQAGKTRLLEETRDRLADDGFLVGYAESTGDHRDLLLLALKDAYARAAAAGKPGVVPPTAGDDRSGLLAQVSAPVLAAVLPGELRETLDLTRRTTAEAGTIGLEPPRPTCDEAFGLVAFLAATSERPTVLFLDDWQKCSPVAQSAAPLRGFLDRPDRWPTCHVFLGVGTDDEHESEAQACLTDLAGSSPLADVQELGGMDLSDSAERRRLLDCLADDVPATRGLEPARILQLLDGRPAVLRRWLALQARDAGRARTAGRRRSAPALP